jgi:hypothetical protein
MLYWAETPQVLHCPVKTEQVGLVDSILAVQQQLGRVPPQEGLEEQADEHSQLPFGVEAAKLGHEVPLNISHPVGGYAHVGGVRHRQRLS